jgi:hypothetical protein
VGALAAVWGLIRHPGPTVGVLALVLAVALAAAGRWGSRGLTDAQRYGPGLWVALRTALRLPDDEDARVWLHTSDALSGEGARVVLRLPQTWLGTDEQKKILDGVITSRVPGEWTGRYHLSGDEPYAEWLPKAPEKKPEPLPEYVKWENTGDPHRIHYGQGRNGPVYVLTKSSTPHVGVAGETGAGKSSLAYIALVSARLAGWLVTVIDPKQNSLVEAQGKSGVRYVTDSYECVMALAEYFTSMMAAEKYNSRRWRDILKKGSDDHPRPVPRLLIIDELPSFRDFVAAWWKFIVKERGFPPVLVWFQIVLMQGRSSDHRVFVGTHQYSLDVFGSTMARDQVGTKMVVGDTSEPSWAVAYGQTTPRLNFDSSVKGRGVISTKGRKAISKPEDRVEEIQYAHLSPEEINEYLDSAPKAPAWFDAGEMAPWITDEDIERADAAGAVRGFLPGGEYVTPQADADATRPATGTPRPRSEARDDVSLTPVDGPETAPASMAELAELAAQDGPAETRYTLAQASQLGIIDRTPGAARTAKYAAIKAGKWFPQGEQRGPHTVYTVAELHEFYGVPKSWNEGGEGAA